MAENNEVPENADKILFAEDLMNHAMNAAETTYTRMTGERYRDLVHNAFNETIREAVTFLYNKVNVEYNATFVDIFHQHSVNLATYTTYAESMSKKYVADGFDASNFLHYCVYIAGMAVNFYIHGVVEAPDLAIMYIVNALNNVDMTTGGWVTLNTVGEKFANTENDILNELSPHSTSESSASSGEQNLDTSEESYPILIRLGSSSLLNEDFKEYEVEIEKMTVEEYQRRQNSNSSTKHKEDLGEFKEHCAASLGNTSNFGENKVENGSSSGDTFAPGTSITTGIAACSMKGDYLDLSLKEINHESAQNVPPPTSEKELEITTKSKRHNLDSEENNFPNKKS